MGMATDFTFIPGVSPRFGDDACWAYHFADDPCKELHCHPERYAIGAQQDGVKYRDLQRSPKVRLGKNTLIAFYEMGERKYDF